MSGIGGLVVFRVVSFRPSNWSRGEREDNERMARKELLECVYERFKKIGRTKLEEGHGSGTDRPSDKNREEEYSGGLLRAFSF